MPRPYVPVRISNPATGKHIETFALIDTGADECALPSIFAKILGHNLVAGEERDVDTGNGTTKAYKHSSVIEIVGYSTGHIFIDYMVNLCVPLLGINSFLKEFVVIFDFPQKVVSLEISD